MQLQADIQALEGTRAELTKELERRQFALVAAEAEVKRFERLEEKEREAWHVLDRQREQAEADDATSRRYTMERRRS